MQWTRMVMDVSREVRVKKGWVWMQFEHGGRHFRHAAVDVGQKHCLPIIGPFRNDSEYLHGECRRDRGREQHVPYHTRHIHEVV